MKARCTTTSTPATSPASTAVRSRMSPVVLRLRQAQPRRDQTAGGPSPSPRPTSGVSSRARTNARPISPVGPVTATVRPDAGAPTPDDAAPIARGSPDIIAHVPRSCADLVTPRGQTARIPRPHVLSVLLVDSSWDPPQRRMISSPAAWTTEPWASTTPPLACR